MEHPADLIPSMYGTDMELRDSLIKAASNGTTDYVRKYEMQYVEEYFKNKYNIWALDNATLDVTAIETEYAEADIWYTLSNGSWNEIAAELNQTEIESAFPFDRPTYDRPIVWSSNPYSATSEYLYDLAAVSGMNVSFVTTGSESSLMELVSDLYAQRLPFLTNIYTTDDNFVVVDRTTGELQQFEKLAFPQNPSESVDDPCYVARECQYPIEPIMKAANPRLTTSFPEAHSFFMGFGMSALQINQIVSYYLDLREENDAKNASDPESGWVSHTEVWLEAACEWLKSKNSAAIATWNTSEWLVDVKRTALDPTYDPITTFEDENESTHVNEYDILDLANRESECPGLLGNVDFDSESRSWNISLETCSGHGTCDSTIRKCKCYDGFNGDACDRPTANSCPQREALLGAMVAVSILWALRECHLFYKRRCGAHNRVLADNSCI